MIDLEKLNKLELEAISLKVSKSRNNIYYINSDIKNSIEQQEPEDKYIINVYIDILGIKSENEKEVNIGKLEANFFESEIVMEDMTFYDICDCVGSDLEPLASEIVDGDGYIKEDICDYCGNLMYIDRIYIEKEYRNIGIASFVIESLNDILSYTLNLHPTTIILLPKPQEKDEGGNLKNIEDNDRKELYTQQLIKFYKRTGFKKIRNSKYMVKKIEN